MPKLKIAEAIVAASNTKEACFLIESGFEYVTGEYNDGGEIFRKRRSS